MSARKPGPLTYEEMLGELQALLGTTVVVQVWAIVDGATFGVMLVEGELARGRALESLQVATAGRESVFFNITTGTAAGFVISETGFSGGGRDEDGSLTFSIGDVVVTVTERGAFAP